MQHVMTKDSSAETHDANHFLGLISTKLGQQLKIEAMVAIRHGFVDMTDIERAIETALSQPGGDYTQLVKTDGMRFIVDGQQELDFLLLGLAGNRLCGRRHFHPDH